MDLVVDVYAAAGHTVLAVSGEVDVYTAHTLRGRLTELIASGRHHLVVDLSEVDFIDSTGLGVLVGGLNKSVDAGGSLALVCQQASMLRLFEITGLDEVFVIHSTTTNAVADVQAPRGERPS
jgi:anti-sigma B factor antagonist